MKISRIFILICIPFLIGNLFGVIYDKVWIVNITRIFIYLPLFIGFNKRLDLSNINILLFFSLSMVAGIFEFFNEESFLFYVAMFFTMASYFFLIREALRYTQRETANMFMMLFFCLLVAMNVYFLYQHLEQMEIHILGFMELGFYSVYYINLLILAIVGLIYYLNSYSRKSVFFITLVMTLVIADVLKDMAHFYLRDTSVIFIESMLSFGSVILAFQFFATREKKLRLINLV